MSVSDYASLEWAEAPMPGASGPVRLARLPEAGDGGFRAFVEFPSRWERTAPGHYAGAEIFLVLEGELKLGSVAIGPGGYGWFPAACTRAAMSTPIGCLVFACFGGLPKWRCGAAEQAPSGGLEWLAHWRDAPSDPGLPGARILPDAPGRRCRMVEPGGRVPDDAPCEVLSLHDRGWRIVAPGGDLPAPGPALVREVVENPSIVSASGSMA